MNKINPRLALAFLSKRYPTIAQRLPLMRGARDELNSVITGLPYDETVGALALLAGSSQYLRNCSAPDAWRHHPITGERVEPVSEEDRAYARAMLPIAMIEELEEQVNDKLDAILRAVESTRCIGPWPE